MASHAISAEAVSNDAAATQDEAPHVHSVTAATAAAAVDPLSFESLSLESDSNDPVPPPSATAASTALPHDDATNPAETENSPPPIVPSTADIEEEWFLKSIAWPPLPAPPSDTAGGPAMEGLRTGGTMRIICQNKNGPCSLLALCNILILRSDIVITPAHRHSVSYQYLSTLLVDFLLRRSLSFPTLSSSTELTSVMEVLPGTRYGLTLNPRFGSIDGFRPCTHSPREGEGTTGELALFALAGVDLRHAWVASADEGELFDLLVEKCGDYDEAIMRVIAGEEIAGDLIDGVNEEEMMQAIEKRSKWSKEEEKVVEEAHMIRQFLASTQTQITYHGLSQLHSQLAPSSLTAFFRNSHLSVLYRRPTSTSSSTSASLSPFVSAQPELFTLVTDSTFLSEPEIVWESLEDVDGSASDFFDGGLRRCRRRGGDYVRRGATSSNLDTAMAPTADFDPDFELAQQLQQQEDYDFNEREDHRRIRTRDESRLLSSLPQPPASSSSALASNRRVDGSTTLSAASAKKEKKGRKDCLIM